VSVEAEVPAAEAAALKEEAPRVSQSSQLTLNSN